MESCLESVSCEQGLETALAFELGEENLLHDLWRSEQCVASCWTKFKWRNKNYSFLYTIRFHLSCRRKIKRKQWLRFLAYRWIQKDQKATAKMFCSSLPSLSVFLGSCRKQWRSWPLSVMWLSCFLKMEVARELPSLLQLQKDCTVLDRSRNERPSNLSPARRVQQGFAGWWFHKALPTPAHR